MRIRVPAAVLAFAVVTGAAQAQQCDTVDTDFFRGRDGPERINLVERGGSDGRGRVVLFRTPLRVNTDGAPTSYKPTDLRGRVDAINNICNGVSVANAATGRRLACPEARTIFARFRDAGWREPPGFRIRWQNVIAARTVDGRTVPCVFESGPHAGYFGSLTTLKNGLPAGQRGACEIDDQIDQRFVPGLVLPSGDNPLRRFGVRIGDVALVHNPANGVSIAAVVADVGPPDNLGEGSVALNMALLGVTRQPRNYSPEALALDTGDRAMIVAVVPGSRAFQLARPYSAENIRMRLERWLTEHGFGEPASFLRAAASCTPN